jgi:3-phenylpropionate/trans-cinnamate dioxygenase ferredoxin component
VSDLVRVCAVGDVPSGEARRFDVDRLRVAVVRIDDDWYAIGDRCTHQDVSLAEGDVHAATLELECFKHGSCFSLTTGEPSTLPATRPVPVYEVRVDGDDVLIREVSDHG